MTSYKKHRGGPLVDAKAQEIMCHEGFTKWPKRRHLLSAPLTKRKNVPPYGWINDSKTLSGRHAKIFRRWNERWGRSCWTRNTVQRFSTASTESGLSRRRHLGNSFHFEAATSHTILTFFDHSDWQILVPKF